MLDLLGPLHIWVYMYPHLSYLAEPINQACQYHHLPTRQTECIDVRLDHYMNIPNWYFERSHYTERASCLV